MAKGSASMCDISDLDTRERSLRLVMSWSIKSGAAPSAHREPNFGDQQNVCYPLNPNELYYIGVVSSVTENVPIYL